MSETLEEKYIYVCNLCEKLTDRLNNIAGLIYYQAPLKEQDEWLKKIIEEGIWRVDDELVN